MFIAEYLQQKIPVSLRSCTDLLTILLKYQKTHASQSSGIYFDVLSVSLISFPVSYKNPDLYPYVGGEASAFACQPAASPCNGPAALQPIDPNNWLQSPSAGGLMPEGKGVLPDGKGPGVFPVPKSQPGGILKESPGVWGIGKEELLRSSRLDPLLSFCWLKLVMSCALGKLKKLGFWTALSLVRASSWCGE